jgi:LysR family transcriptional regulator, glycine cleavage system transcriptional activator
MTTARALRHEGADLVIAWNRGHYPPGEQARAIPLGPIAFGPVCAPDSPVEAGAGRLAAATRIAHEHIGHGWTTWAERAGRALDCRAELRFPHTHLCIEAALAGLGLALVEQRLVREELASGRLLAPCGFTPFPEGLAALPTSPRAASPAARAFLDWLRGTLA